MPLQLEDESWRRLLRVPPELVPQGYSRATLIAPGPTTATHAGMTLDEVLRARRTVREFAEVPLPDATLSAILRAAWAADTAQFGADTPEGAQLVALVAVAQVSDCPAGIYAVAGAGSELRRLEHAPSPSTLHDSYPAAPALLLVCADVTAAARALGGRGYPRALCQAAAFGYAAWLAALSFGLAGSVYGGAATEVTRWARDALGTPVRHLFTVALGAKA